MNAIINRLKGKAIVITGHFGCGKTNVAVNLAEMTAPVSKTYLIDFDNVNPYFRSADSAFELTQCGVNVIIPEFANTNVDIPSISPRIFTALTDVEKGSTAYIDVGGDMLGAVSVGSIYKRIKDLPHEVLYVYSAFRPMTDTPEKAYEVLKEIEEASGLPVTALINNSNIGDETDTRDIESTAGFSDKLCCLSGLPLLFTSFMTNESPSVDGYQLRIKNKTKKLF